MKMRFGLEDGIPHTLEEVGREFNVTRERIRQIEGKVLEKLRAHPMSVKISDELPMKSGKIIDIPSVSFPFRKAA